MDTSSQLNVLQAVAKIWPVKTEVCSGLGVYTMWARDNLHSVATVAGQANGFVRVPVIQWATLRMLGDRLHVPTVIFFGHHDGTIEYATWPVHSGLKYQTILDTAYPGGVVSIPRSEFKIVERKRRET